MRNFIGRNGFKWFVGVVEDRNDPIELGRVRVRAFGWHTDDKGAIPTEELPWAVPINSIDSASVSGVGKSPTGMVEGSWVFGFFMDGDRAQEPAIMGTLPGIPSEKSNSAFGFNEPQLWGKRVAEGEGLREFPNEDGMNALMLYHAAERSWRTGQTISGVFPSTEVEDSMGGAHIVSKAVQRKLRQFFNSKRVFIIQVVLERV